MCRFHLQHPRDKHTVMVVPALLPQETTWEGAGDPALHRGAGDRVGPSPRPWLPLIQVVWEWTGGFRKGSTWCFFWNKGMAHTLRTVLSYGQAGGVMACWCQWRALHTPPGQQHWAGVSGSGPYKEAPHTLFCDPVIPLTPFVYLGARGGSLTSPWGFKALGDTTHVCPTLCPRATV